MARLKEQLLKLSDIWSSLWMQGPIMKIGTWCCQWLWEYSTATSTQQLGYLLQRFCFLEWDWMQGSFLRSLMTWWREASTRSVTSTGESRLKLMSTIYKNCKCKLAVKHANLQQQSVVDKLVDKSDGEVRDFMPGDWVVCPWRGGKPGKLSLTYQGPYNVIKKLSSTTYSV